MLKCLEIKGLKTSGAKKKFLGVLIIIAFVAFFANVATRYIVISEINLETTTLAAVVIIIILLLFIWKRKKKQRKKRLRKKRKHTRKKRR